MDWYDIDFPEVIALREELMPHRENAHPVGVSLLEPDWIDTIPPDRPTILVADGLFGFLTEEGNKRVLARITDHFAGGELVFNAHTKVAARMTGFYTRSVGMPKGCRGSASTTRKTWSCSNPRLTFVDEQTGVTAPESEQLTGLYRLLGRWFARWPVQARRDVWVVRYRF